jgi:bifunctional non-homologous end joining protein LigD
MTRNKNDWTEKFSDLSAEIHKLNLKSAILDGELIALNKKNRSDFQLLSNSIHNKKGSKLIYVIFDLIYYQGKDLSRCALQDRKEILRTLIPLKNKKLIFSEHINGKDGDVFFKKACKEGFEGIISKRSLSPYIQGQNKNWLKIKCIKRQEFLVIGFAPAKGSRHSFGALLLAVYNNKNQLQYCGKVGTGFNEKSLKNISILLNKFKTEKVPFKVLPPAIGPVSWVLPKIVVEVGFTKWTQASLLRHPSFKGLLNDKKPREIIKE